MIKFLCHSLGWYARSWVGRRVSRYQTGWKLYLSFDGDIPQLQTMLFEAWEALYEAEKIVRSKHLVSATGTQQPCDLSAVFRLLKFVQKKATLKGDLAVGLRHTIDDLFSVWLRQKSLNLDGNPRKKEGSCWLSVMYPRKCRSSDEAEIYQGFICWVWHGR